MNSTELSLRVNHSKDATLRSCRFSPSIGQFCRIRLHRAENDPLFF
jgi:hypothetical protein